MFCGIKLTHDSAVAVIDEDQLLFSIELEKVSNNKRYYALNDIVEVEQILLLEGVDSSRLSSVAIDGWGTEENASGLILPTQVRGISVGLPVAPYIGGLFEAEPLKRQLFNGVAGSILANGYSSYSHVAGHILASYCTSPFAPASEDSLVLCWDGGMLPQLYNVSSQSGSVRALGPLSSMVGNFFSRLCLALPPFQPKPNASSRDVGRLELEVPGKAMAYAAKGRVDQRLFGNFTRFLNEMSSMSASAAKVFAQKVVSHRAESVSGLSDADLIASFQAFIGEQLVGALEKAIKRFGSHRPNLCLAGGCALNIKWNSVLRDSGIVGSIWVPPFTNDSGAAIGAACCDMFRLRRKFPLKWSVYSGPQLGSSTGDWSSRGVNAEELGRMLHHEGEPVVVLYGRAELGPRALGNRSILAPATSFQIKDRLNGIKGREAYRPVAPICLADRATEVFSPGGHDPYMLFDHRVRPEWVDRIPGVIHLDGSARLQTIDRQAEGTAAHKILQAYEEVSGIPVLCNTSANMNGRGFFPDVMSAMDWGKIKYIWTDGILYTNPLDLSY